MNGKKLMLVVALVALIAMVGTSAFAVDSPDQSQELQTSSQRVFATRYLCQTFTAGLTGNLTMISLLLDATGSETPVAAVISILGTTAGFPDDSKLLWTTGSQSPALRTWLDVDTSTGAPFLIAGEVYGIKIATGDLSSAVPNYYWCVQTETPELPKTPYSAGQLFDYRGSSWEIVTTNGGPEQPDADAAFRTYVLEWVEGDTNGDRVVDATDFITMKRNFGLANGATLSQGDLNNDEAVNYDDLQILIGAFGSRAGSPSTAPEPATLSLLAIGALALIRRRRA